MAKPPRWLRDFVASSDVTRTRRDQVASDLARLPTSTIGPRTLTAGIPYESVQQKIARLVKAGSKKKPYKEQVRSLLELLPGSTVGPALEALVSGKPGTGLALAAMGALDLVPFGKIGSQAGRKLLAKEIAEKAAQGFSYHPATGRFLTQETGGFAVGAGSKVKRLLTGENLTPAQIEKFLEKHADYFQKNPNAILGGWTDQSGKTHIEPSELFTSRTEAAREGMRRGEQAIWDFARNREISTKPFATEHYSPKSDLTKLETKFAGTGPLRGAERSRTERLPAVHLYRAGARPEPGLRGLTKYTADIPEGQLYDLGEDPMGLLRSGMGGDQLEQAIQKLGYSGYRSGAYPDLLKTFEDIPVARTNVGGLPAAPEVLGAAPEASEIKFMMPDGSEFVSRGGQAPNELHADMLAEGIPAKQGAEESIKEAAIRMPDGRVFRGRDHFAAIEQATAQGVPNAELESAADGFLTSGGRFVNREEAYTIHTGKPPRPYEWPPGLMAEEVNFPGAVTRAEPTGLRSATGLASYGDPLAQVFMDKFGEEEGKRRFNVFMKTIAALKGGSG